MVRTFALVVGSELVSQYLAEWGAREGVAVLPNLRHLVRGEACQAEAAQFGCRRSFANDADDRADPLAASFIGLPEDDRLADAGVGEQDFLDPFRRDLEAVDVDPQ